jgi:hypothetical protein
MSGQHNGPHARIAIYTNEREKIDKDIFLFGLGYITNRSSGRGGTKEGGGLDGENSLP